MSASSVFYKNSFPKVGAAVYLMGIVSFIASLVFKFPIQEMPDIMHYIILFAGTYSGLGFLFYFNKIISQTILVKFIYILIIIHLLGSAYMHAYSLWFHTNEWIYFFPNWYKFFAIAYFTPFGVLCYATTFKED